MVLWVAAPLPRHRMGVVEADEPPAIRPVQRQRIVQAMRFFRRGRHFRHHEADPMVAIRVHNEHLPIKVEQHIEGRVARLRHSAELSD